MIRKAGCHVARQGKVGPEDMEHNNGRAMRIRLSNDRLKVLTIDDIVCGIARVNRRRKSDGRYRVTIGLPALLHLKPKH
jgi:hypothetical protein